MVKKRIAAVMLAIVYCMGLTGCEPIKIILNTSRDNSSIHSTSENSLQELQLTSSEPEANTSKYESMNSESSVNTSEESSGILAENSISDEEKMQRIENILEIPAECKEPDLLHYAVEKRKEAFLKWDFRKEIPKECIFLGEIVLKLNSAFREYALFQINAEISGRNCSYVWWARKEGDGHDDGKIVWEYTEAKDTGILWQAPDLDSFYSYYGVADEQAFYDQVLTEDFYVFDFVMYNSVEALDLYKHSYDYWLSLVESRKE